MSVENTQHADLIAECSSVMSEIFARCHENAPNFGVSEETFRNSLTKTAGKFLNANTVEATNISAADLKEFLLGLQADNLFMAQACAGGNERAWWEFDQQHRNYLERVARHLASTELNAQEVIDTVYIELYGTRVVDGERISKFSTYSGRGSLRGWLRTIIWHSLVDLHRASPDEISLDAMTENVGEGYAHAHFADVKLGGEEEMIEKIAKDRYLKATLNSIENAFAHLDNHEKLLLLYYHVENLKLREIARMVENTSSPLRGWFQRKSTTREQNPETRIHESTIMRWLERSYAKVLKMFRAELLGTHKLSEEEIEICMELATKDLASPNLYRNLTAT